MEFDDALRTGERVKAVNVLCQYGQRLLRAKERLGSGNGEMTCIRLSGCDLVTDSMKEGPDLSGVRRERLRGGLATDVDTVPQPVDTTIRRQAEGDGDARTRHDDDLLVPSELERRRHSNTESICPRGSVRLQKLSEATFVSCKTHPCQDF